MKIRKELWFGFIIMGLIIAGTRDAAVRRQAVSGHLGLMMLALVVVAIMLGFPTAFTLMGMACSSLAGLRPEHHPDARPDVQAAFKVMSNDVLISIHCSFSWATWSSART